MATSSFWKRALSFFRVYLGWGLFVLFLLIFFFWRIPSSRMEMASPYTSGSFPEQLGHYSPVASSLPQMAGARDIAFHKSFSPDYSSISSGGAVSDTSGGASPIAEDTKVIKSGSLSLEVPDTDKARKEVEKRVLEFGGAITDMNSWQVRDRKLAYQIVIRISPEKLETFMENLMSLGIKRAQNISSTDITAGYQDTENRIRSLEARRDRLRAMLLQKTENLSDVLQIDRELANVQTEIENLSSLQKSRNRDVAYSRFVLTLEPEVQVGDFSDSTWTIGRAWRNFVNMFVDSSQGLVDRIFYIFATLPLWGTLVLVFFAVRFFWKKRFSRLKK